MASPRPVDLLKTILNTLVLVAGGVGSVLNLLRGNGLPAALLVLVAAVVIVIIIAELRSSRNREAAVAEMHKDRQPSRELVAPRAPAMRAGPAPVVSRPTWRIDESGRAVIAAVRRS